MPKDWAAALAFAAQKEPLPKGVYFDGNHYVDFDGKLSQVSRQSVVTL